jgi:hypothetical protein
MSLLNPRAEAEWLLETIIDDFALSIEAQDRARFYARLAELLIQRHKRVQRVLDGAEPGPDSPQQVH